MKKRCRKCQEQKSTAEFHKHSRSPDGLQTICKDCLKDPLLYIWKGIKARCFCKTHKSYPWYGGRGIKMCERWATSFENFCADMGERPIGVEIDRIDNDGDYEPGNCRWVDKTTQQRNRRGNRIVLHAGKIQCLAAWEEELGLSRGAISHRLKAGWSIEKALQSRKA